MNRETRKMPSAHPRPPEEGFSLMETLIVISIVAILLVLGVPTFKFVTQSNRSTSEINGMLGSLQLARAEAIKEGQSVSVCPSANGIACTVVSNDWQQGWLIFSDTGVLGVIDGTDFVVHVQTPFTSADTLQTDHNVSVITFSREGFAMNLPNGVTFTLHNSTASASYTRCLSLTIVGALSTQIAGYPTAEGFPCT
jgi:type IV fimbrial biogenesis protein FimT